MKTRIRGLTVELLLRKKFQKVELRKMLIKSITQNKNINLSKRLFFTKLLDKTTKYGTISKQHELCISTGRAKGIVSLLSLSRQSTKRFGLHNKLQNIRVASW